jgi:hypothetical protein
VRGGENWFFAWIDNDDSETWDTGEPAGLVEYQPLSVGWDSANYLEIGLTDEAPPATFRLAWEPVEGTTMYTVTVTRITTPGAPVVLSKVIEDRAYLHEGDFPFGGLDDGGSISPTYQYYVGSNTALVTFQWPSSHGQPDLLWPIGANIYHARNDFVFRAHEKSTLIDLEVYPGTGTTALLDEQYEVPYLPEDGIFRFRWPFYPGDVLPDGSGTWSNGVYRWRLRSRDPRNTSPFSDYGTFTLDLQDYVVGPSMIEGEVFYYGKAAATQIVVQAFRDAGFSLEPEAQIVLPEKGAFRLLGLRPGTYYVRAFVDSDGNGQHDAFESSGFVRPTAFYLHDYHPKAITVPDSVSGQRLVIRDTDIDNDGLPDAWEYQFMGDLVTAGPGTDFDGDGLSDLREYEVGLLDTDPTDEDTDGDGLTDYQEVNWDGSLAYNPYDPWTRPMGTDLDPHKPDTDGDGLTDGYEVNTAGTNPLSSDSDGDGAPDGVEIAAGSNPHLPNSDGDGYGDAIEIALGSDPNDPGSVPSAADLLYVTGTVILGPTSNQVDYDVLPQVTNLYQDVVVGVESATDLFGPFTYLPGSDRTVYTTNWFGGPWHYIDQHDGSGLRFYRARWRISE